MTEARFDVTALKALYDRISRPEGVEVAALRALLAELFARPRSEADLQAFREGRGPWKKLADEVAPVSAFLAREGAAGRVRFALNDEPPDAVLYPPDEGAPVAIEVTRVQGRARAELGRDLRGGKPGRGFIDLPEDVSQTAFDEARAKGRVMHVRDGIVRAIEASAVERLVKKSAPRFQDQVLLMLASLGSAPDHDWSGLRKRLAPLAATSPLARVVVMDDGRARGPLVEIWRRGDP